MAWTKMRASGKQNIMREAGNICKKQPPKVEKRTPKSEIRKADGSNPAKKAGKLLRIAGRAASGRDARGFFRWSGRRERFDARRRAEKNVHRHDGDDENGAHKMSPKFEEGKCNSRANKQRFFRVDFRAESAWRKEISVRGSRHCRREHTVLGKAAGKNVKNPALTNGLVRARL